MNNNELKIHYKGFVASLYYDNAFEEFSGVISIPISVNFNAPSYEDAKDTFHNIVDKYLLNKEENYGI